MITRDEAKLIATEVTNQCRLEVDAKLDKMHEGLWTEARAKSIAEEAADIAVRKITDGFYMSIGKKVVTTVGATFVILFIFFKEEIVSWITGKRH